MILPGKVRSFMRFSLLVLTIIAFVTLKIHAQSGTIQALYKLPNSLQNGSMDFSVNMKYQFELQTIGQEEAYIILRMDIGVSPATSNGEYHYKYNGTVYSHGQLNQKDASGTAGFRDVVMKNLIFEIYVQGEGYQKTIQFEQAIGHKEVMRVKRTANPKNFTLSVRSLESVYCTNTTAVEKRITDFLSQKNKGEGPADAKATAATGASTAANDLWATDTNDPGASSGQTTSASSGNNHVPDTEHARKKQTGSSENKAWSNQQVEDYLQKDAASRQAKYDAIIKQGKEERQKISQSFQSYYAAQSVTDARNNIVDNSTLSGNYTSREQLEAEFNQKYDAIGQNAQQLGEANRNYIQATKEYFTSSGTAEQKAVGELVGGIATLLGDAQAEKAEREAKERLETERAAAAARLKAAKKARMIESREGLFKLFPEGGIPLSSHKIMEDELYFFSYTFMPSAISADNPILSISNVFPLARYNDGTWPFKSSVTDNIKKLSNNGSVTLIGYYTSQKLADEMHGTFLNLARKCGFITKEITYKGKKASGTGGAAPDFWKQQAGSAENKTPVKKAEADFWRNNKSVGPESEKPKPEKNGGFWD